VAPPPQKVDAGRPAPSSASTAVPEHLAIRPRPSGVVPGTLEFDWEPVTLGSNQSFIAVVSVPNGAVSVTLSQELYRRQVEGEHVRVGPVPPAAAGTEGSLTARHTTGESVTFTWRWEPKRVSAPPPAAGGKGGLLSRLFGRSKTADAPAAARAAVKPALSVGERLGSRASLATAVRFFGVETIGQRFAFILDRSGSMHGARWNACLDQFERALQSMPAHAEFVVLLFTTDVDERPNASGWASAHPDNVRDALNWVRSMRPGGGTAAAPAFEHAFGLGVPPDVIFFLTDGDIAGFAPTDYMRMSNGAPTILNTIALECGTSAEALNELAQATGGQFTMIGSAEAAS